VGEKGNVGASDVLAASNPLSALDALPIDALKNSPETVNAWFDTYLKYRTVRDMGRTADAAEKAADVAETSARTVEDRTPHA
jgi:hypothetical protein